MIIYKKCSEVELEKVYNSFRTGFSDYIIKLELSKEDFVKRFLGPEGNDLKYSFIAFDEEEPVGVILGGIKNYEGTKTMRCGSLCIHPEYRGKGISQELFRLHKQTALDNECKQMFLEVIAGNERAVKFYSKLGYTKVYNLSYYTLYDTAKIKYNEDISLDIKPISCSTIRALSEKLGDLHINWQNEFEYVEKLDGVSYFGAYKASELVGALSINASGKIFFIWTALLYRHRGIATSLVFKAVRELQLKRLNISFSNNSKLEGFSKAIGFQKDMISQCEMYLTL